MGGPGKWTLSQTGRAAQPLLLGVALPRVDNTHDLHRVLCDAIDDDVVRVRYQFAGPRNTPRPEQVGVFGQWQHRLLDHAFEASGRRRIPLRDVENDSEQVVPGAGLPDNRQYAAA